jgi:TonB family protein
MASLSLFGQEPGTLETLVVESPLYVGSATKKELTPVVAMHKKPINEFIENNLMCPYEIEPITDEGVVVVRFMVEPNGQLSDYRIENSVSRQVDNSVIRCLQLTSGNWRAGRVNGEPTAMESKVYVHFDLPGNATNIDLARNYMSSAVTHYNKGCEVELPSMAVKKANRHFKSTLWYLQKANQYAVDEVSIVFMESKAYEKLGDWTNRDLKIRKMTNLLATQLIQEGTEVAYISMK